MSDRSRPSLDPRLSAALLPAWQRGADVRLMRAFAIAACVHAAAIAMSVRPSARAPGYQLPHARVGRLPPPLTILPPVARERPGGGAATGTPGPVPLGSASASAEPNPVPVAPPTVATAPPGVATGVPTGQGGAGNGGGAGGDTGPGSGGGGVRQEYEPARLLSLPWPHYPEAARKQKISGGVVLSVHVTAEGLVDSVRVVRGLAVPELNLEAVHVARGLRYEAARLGARAVASWQAYTVTFDKP